MPDQTDSLFLKFQAALAGRYSLERELGRGGMGVVYLAREVRLDRLVAIKLLPPELAAHESLRERFLREARTAARLSHPNIVAIYAVDDVASFVFYVMAFVDGDTLARRITTRGALPPAEAARILREVAWALAYAHAQGVVHRDVKPENILLEAGSGRAMVTDLGIARLAEASGQTQAGELLGTPEYMSPEQASGEPVDGRSDLYSLGVVGYYMLSGKLPFSGPSTQAVLAQHITQPAPPLASVVGGVPPALAQAVDRSLCKNPDDRFANGEALAEALGAALQAPRETPVPVRVFLDRRRMLILIAPASIGALQLILVAVRTANEGAAAPSRVPIAVVGALLLVFPLLLTLRRLRRLLGLGYGPEDLTLGLRLGFERRREEFQYEYGTTPSVRERTVRAIAIGAGTTLLLGAAWAVFGNAFRGGAAWAAALSGYVGGIAWALTTKWRRMRLDTGSWWARFWSGRAGRWLCRVAGKGLTPTAVVATARPTEFAIGSAVQVLYEGLPKEVRAVVGDFPTVVRQLEAQAQRTRTRVAELDQFLAQANQRPGRSPNPAQRDALIGDLHAARELAHARLGEAVAALETLRLDLLRLRAGGGTIESLTADLAAARELGQQADLLLQGRGEVEQLLRKP